MFDILLSFFTSNINREIWDNENVKTENVPIILIVHSFILLLVYNVLLYSFFKYTKATGLGKKANLFISNCELGDTDEKIALWQFYEISMCSCWEN